MTDENRAAQIRAAELDAQIAEERAAKLDSQIAEIGDALGSLLVPNLDGRLREALTTAIAAVKERASTADLDRVFITVGSAYITLRQALDLLGGRLAAVHEDMVGQWEYQERDAAVNAAGIAALAVIHAEARLLELEARVLRLEKQDR